MHEKQSLLGLLWYYNETIFSFKNALRPHVPPSVSGVNVRMRLLSFVLLLLLSAASAGADSKAITTTLTTKWADTPLLLEAR